MQNPANQAQSSGQTNQSIGKGLISKTPYSFFVYRVPGFLFCTWFILRFLNIPIPYFTEISKEYLLIYPGIVWLYSIAKDKGFGLLYPLVLIFVFPIGFSLFLIKVLFGIIKFPVKVWNLTQSAQNAIILILITLVSLIISISSTDPKTSAVLSIISLVAYYLLFLQSFKWALNPFRPIGRILESVQKFISWIVDAVMKQENIQSQTPEINVWAGWARKLVDYLDPDQSSTKQGLTVLAKDYLIAASLLLFVFLHFTIATLSAYTLQKVELAWGALFSGISSTPTFFDYFYLTLLSQTSAVPGEITPISFWGRFWIVASVSTGVLLIGVLLASFTTAIGVQGDQAKKEFRSFFDNFRKQIADWEHPKLPNQPSAAEARNEIIDVQPTET